MSLIADIEVPVSDLGAGDVLDEYPSVSIEFERVVPSHDEPFSLFWAFGDERDLAVERLHTGGVARTVTPIESLDDRSLYRVDWAGQFDVVVSGLRRTKAQVLKSSIADGRWSSRLRFAEKNDLRTFGDDVREQGVGLELVRIRTVAGHTGCTEPFFGLTGAQRRALTLAVERGYFEIPRGCTAAEIGEELGISDQAVSERLRRAITTLVDETILPTTAETARVAPEE